MAVLEFIPDHAKQHDRSGTGLMWIFFNVSLEAVTYKDTILATEVANFSHHNGEINHYKYPFPSHRAVLCL
jgi:hypothetical protein